MSAISTWARHFVTGLLGRARALFHGLGRIGEHPSRKAVDDFWSGVHICPGPSEWSEWKPSHEAYSDVAPERIIHPPCCVRRRRADQCVTRFGYQDYYDATPQDRCAPGMGCNANPKERAGKEGREWMVYGE